MIEICVERSNNRVRKKPKWFVRPTSDIKGKHVLLVDDICVAGRTLKKAKKALLDKGAAEVRTATLAIHPDSARPDYYVIESDDLIIFPWDKQILSGLQWAMNPEYQQEIDSIQRNGWNCSLMVVDPNFLYKAHLTLNNPIKSVIMDVLPTPQLTYNPMFVPQLHPLMVFHKVSTKYSFAIPT